MRSAGGVDQQILTTQDLFTRGYTHAAIRRAVAKGTLVRLRRGRYRRARPSDTLPIPQWPDGEAELRHRYLLRAALPFAPGTVASHHSAAILHGLPMPNRILGKVSMLRPGSGQGTCTSTRQLRRAALPASDIVEIGGIPATSLPRTVIDVARTLPFADAVPVVDAALHAAPSPDLLRSTLLAQLAHRQSGNAAARRAVLFADSRAESPGESRCRAAFELAGLPIPELQFEITNAEGEFVARTDFRWPGLPLVGEYDGMVKYRGDGAGSALWDEKRREDRIRELGWDMVRFIHTDLADLGRLRARLQQAFQRTSGRRAG